MPSTADPLTLHTSWRGLLAAAITPVAFVGFGSLAISGGGVRGVPIAVVVIGVVLAVGVAYDFPSRTRFDGSGLTRVCLIRHHHVPWEQVAAIERTRPNSSTTMRNLTIDRDDRQVSGGLIARGRGRRRWLLTDQVESRMEHDRLAALIRDLDAPVGLRATRPHDGVAPTNLYRRRRSPDPR